MHKCNFAMDIKMHKWLDIAKDKASSLKAPRAYSEGICPWRLRAEVKGPNRHKEAKRHKQHED